MNLLAFAWLGIFILMQNTVLIIDSKYYSNAINFVIDSFLQAHWSFYNIIFKMWDFCCCCYIFIDKWGHKLIAGL